jgi:hypothetical protein
MPAIVGRLLSQDHFSQKADMVACGAPNSFEETAPLTGSPGLSMKTALLRFSTTENLPRKRGSLRRLAGLDVG